MKKEYYLKHRKRISLKNKKLRKENKAKYILKGIKDRCNNPNVDNYKYYGNRGIRNFLTKEDIEYLMKRDNYYQLIKPTIDREDNDGHYELGNCRFIENYKNISKMNKESKIKPIIQFNLINSKTRFFKSATEASKILKVPRSSIVNSLRNRYI